MMKWLKEQIEAFEWLQNWINKKFKNGLLVRGKLVKTALIVLIIIFLGFKLLLFLWPKPIKSEKVLEYTTNRTGKDISSANQSGGITAEQVIINSLSPFKGADFVSMNHSEGNRKKDTRNKLRQFYGELKVWSDHPIPKGNMDALQDYEMRVNKWVSDTCRWIEINLGFAAREIFLNREAGGRIWSSDYDERFKQLLSDFERYKIGLEKLISSDEMWIEK